MANRNFNRFQALEKEIKSLYAEVAIGASGAPTVTKALGITSVVRNSAGLYTITLDDKYNRLMSVEVRVVAPTAEDLNVQMAAADVTSAKTVQIRCVAAGVATDPASGDSLLIRIDLKNSSV